MDGRQRAFECHGRTQFMKGEVRFLNQQSPQLALMILKDHWLAPGPMVARTNIPSPPTLLQKLLHHAQGNSITMRDLLPGTFFVVVGSQNPFPQIQR
jgi:hypothetical protein